MIYKIKVNISETCPSIELNNVVIYKLCALATLGILSISGKSFKVVEIFIQNATHILI